MARNPIQFQDGLSLTKFIERFGREEQCAAALTCWRWPDGFVCPKCGSRDHAIVGKRRLYECHSCRRQTSLKAGTIFAHSLVPLTKWFQAMWLLTQSKSSIATLELARKLDLKWDSAWLMRQKLTQVMLEREAATKLDGRIEMDDAVLGGERSELDGGKRGRGGPNKIPFVIAVETVEGRPQRVKMPVVSSFTSAEIERITTATLAPTARVVSDGLACFRSVTAAGCAHEPVIVEKTSHGCSEKVPEFRWVNIVLGNVKTAITGTFHSIRRPYVPRCLAEFAYRFNRRSRLPDMLDRLAVVAIRTGPRPYAVITFADTYG
jgi:transposase-like protein